MKSYVAGFLLSVILTLAAAALIVAHERSGHTLFTHEFLYAAAVVCALLQAAVQLLCFLHVGQRGNAMNRVALAFALVFIGIVVGGSLWIMTNLNGRMTPSMGQMLQYMQEQS